MSQSQGSSHRQRNTIFGIIGVISFAATLYFGFSSSSESTIPTVIINGPESTELGSTVKFLGDDSFDPDGGSIIKYTY